MHIIKMEHDKSLVVTVRAPVYVGESNIDSVDFLLPKLYNGVQLSDCSILLQYTLPGSAVQSEVPLDEFSEYNSGYLKYSLMIAPELTASPGTIDLRLRVVNAVGELILLTGKVGILVQEPSGNSGGGGASSDFAGRLAALEAESHSHENKTILDLITSDKVAQWDAQSGSGAIEGIQIGGSELPIISKIVNISLATEGLPGVVNSSAADNGVRVLSGVAMEVNSLNVVKLTQTAGDELIINGGD